MIFTPQLAATVPAAPASSKRTVTIQNRAADVIRGVHVTPVEQDNWGPDLLRQNIAIKQSLAIALEGDGCRYDIRIILGDRPREQLLMDLDVRRQR